MNPSLLLATNKALSAFGLLVFSVWSLVLLRSAFLWGREIKQQPLGARSNKEDSALGLALKSSLKVGFHCQSYTRIADQKFRYTLLGLWCVVRLSNNMI